MFAGIAVSAVPKPAVLDGGRPGAHDPHVTPVTVVRRGAATVPVGVSALRVVALGREYDRTA